MIQWSCSGQVSHGIRYPMGCPAALSFRSSTGSVLSIQTSSVPRRCVLRNLQYLFRGILIAQAGAPSGVKYVFTLRLNSPVLGVAIFFGFLFGICLLCLFFECWVLQFVLYFVKVESRNLSSGFGVCF